MQLVLIYAHVTLGHAQSIDRVSNVSKGKTVITAQFPPTRSVTTMCVDTMWLKPVT